MIELGDVSQVHHIFTSTFLPLGRSLFTALSADRAMCNSLEGIIGGPRLIFMLHTAGPLGLTFRFSNLLQNKNNGQISLFVFSESMFSISFPTILHKCKVKHCKLGKHSFLHTDYLNVCYIFRRHKAKRKGFFFKGIEIKGVVK